MGLLRHTGGRRPGGGARHLAFYSARYFGRRAFGAIVGVLGLTIGVSIALGGFAFAAFADRGGYGPALVAGAVTTTLAAMLLLSSGLNRAARRPQRMLES